MKVFDLSRPISQGMPGHIPTSIMPLRRHGDSEGVFQPPCEGFASSVLVMSDHCGTHMDAPVHFIRGGQTTDQMQVDGFIGPAVVCDVSSYDTEAVERDQLDAGLEQAAGLPAGGFLLLKTRNGSGPGRGITRETAERLIELGVRLVGTDSGGIDNASDPARPGHMTLLAKDIPIVESLVDLGRLGSGVVLFIALPLALESATGSPVRAVAVEPFPTNWFQPDSGSPRG